MPSTEPRYLPRSLWRFTWLRFAVVGVSNTLVGLSVIYLCWRLLGWSDAAANVTGFAVGWLWSFGLHRRVTFRSSGPVAAGMLRYAGVCLFAYAVNLGVVLGTRHVLAADSFVPHLLGNVAYSAIVYFASRTLVFAAVRDGDDGPTSAAPVLLGLLLVQVALQAWFFPATALWTGQPLNYIDSPFHQYQMAVARQLCEQRRLIGYDPFFAAGYMGGVTFNASAKLPALLECAVDAPTAVAPIYKAFSFAMGVLDPLALVLTGALLGWRCRPLVVLALFSLLVWWTGPLRWYHTAGLVSYAAIACWVLPYAALVSRVCRRPGARGLAALALGSALGLLVHPLFPVAALLLCLPMVLADLAGHGGPKRVLWVAALAAIAALAVNAGWLEASFAAQNFATVEQPFQRLVDPWLVVEEPLGIARTATAGSRLYLAFLVGDAAALALSRGRTRRRLLGMSIGAALLMAWASLGALSHGIAALQPNRFSMLAWLALAVPAAWGTSALIDALAEPRPPAQRRWAAGALAVVAGVSLFFMRETFNEVFTQRSARYAVARPEVKGEGPISRAIVDWLRADTDGGARVYFEQSMGRIHDGAHMAGSFAAQTGREFIGGPYSHTDFASAWDDFAFGHRLEQISPAAMTAYLDRYNVRWMLCHSAACKKAMAALPDTRWQADIGPVSAYARAAAPGWFFEGSGTVERRCINRVEFAVDGAPDEIVLRYHWLPGLATRPAAAVSARYVGDDPRPFVVVTRPPARFALGVGEPAPGCATATP